MAIRLSIETLNLIDGEITTTHDLEDDEETTITELESFYFELRKVIRKIEKKIDELEEDEENIDELEDSQSITNTEDNFQEYNLEDNTNFNS